MPHLYWDIGKNRWNAYNQDPYISVKYYLYAGYNIPCVNCHSWSRFSCLFSLYKFEFRYLHTEASCSYATAVDAGLLNLFMLWTWFCLHFFFSFSLKFICMIMLYYFFFKEVFLSLISRLTMFKIQSVVKPIICMTWIRIVKIESCPHYIFQWFIYIRR